MNRFPMPRLKKSRKNRWILIDFSVNCGRILWICKDIAETKRVREIFSERGAVKALDFLPQATSSVARDDRDGCSRYRAAKMSPPGTN